MRVIPPPAPAAVPDVLTRFLEVELSADGAIVDNAHLLKGRARGQLAESAYLLNLGGPAPGFRHFGGRGAMLLDKAAGVGVRSPFVLSPLLDQPKPGTFAPHGRGMYRIIVTLATAALTTPTKDVGLRFLLSGNPGSNRDWTTDAAGGDNESGFGVLMQTAGRWTFVVKAKVGAGLWAEQVPLAWPAAVGEWATLDVRIFDARPGKNAYMELRVNDILAIRREWRPDGTALPNWRTNNRPGFCRWRVDMVNDVSGPALYVADWREILGRA